MKIVGLITEYNPFHNGHLYHIEESLRITGADKVIVVMSGDFVQRGAPAIMPKHLRAKMALQAGASLVIELPVRYATGSAEFFSHGAIALLHQLGCVDYICFGSESGDIEALSSIADLLLREPVEYQQSLQNHLRSGLSYPLARQRAMEAYLQSADNSEILQSILSEPNNILGIEYLKALKQHNSSIKPYTITRKTSHYHDEELKGTCSSASAIRMQMHHLPSIQEQIPEACYELMSSHCKKRYPIYMDDFSLLLHSQLLNETKETLIQYEDMTAELANRIINYRNQFISVEQFSQLLNSKNMTHARIRRVLLHILLGIRNRTLAISYIHILGFRKDDQELLSAIKANSTLPIITKLTTLNSLDDAGMDMIQEDIHASNLYEAAVTNKYQQPFIHELEKSLVLL